MVHGGPSPATRIRAARLSVPARSNATYGPSATRTCRSHCCPAQSLTATPITCGGALTAGSSRTDQTDNQGVVLKAPTYPAFTGSCSSPSPPSPRPARSTSTSWPVTSPAASTRTPVGSSSPAAQANSTHWSPKSSAPSFAPPSSWSPTAYPSMQARAAPLRRPSCSPRTQRMRGPTGCCSCRRTSSRCPRQASSRTSRKSRAPPTCP